MLLKVFGKHLELTLKAAPALLPLNARSTGGWRTIVEPYTGGWQQNTTPIDLQSVLTNPTVAACVARISNDISKLPMQLVQRDDDGIWTETESPAFSPFLRKPNAYQTWNQFSERWMQSKLYRGNTYAVKQRDARGVVIAAHVLNPESVMPLVTPAGDVYYELKKDDLSGQQQDQVIVPASEIFHDRMNCVAHPLIGTSPIYAAATVAQQANNIQQNSSAFFANGANPSGMLTAPGKISDETAARLLATILAKKPGEILVGGDSLDFKQFTMSAVDAQLIEQSRWSAEMICSAFGIHPYMICIGPPPPYANIESLQLLYHSGCIQYHTRSFEWCLDEGLGLVAGKIDGRWLGTEFDIDDLIWMDTLTKTKAAADAVGAAVMTPNEARKKHFGLPPIPGGDAAYLQAQNRRIEELANPPDPEPAPVVAPTTEAVN